MSDKSSYPPVGSNSSSGSAARPKTRTAPTRRSQSRPNAKQAEREAPASADHDVASKVVAPWDLPDGSGDWKSEFAFQPKVPPQQSAAQAAIAAAAAARREYGQVTERPRWGRARTDMQDRSLDKAVMRVNPAVRSLSSPSSRPNPLLSGGSPTKPTQDCGRVSQDGFEQGGRPPAPPTSTIIDVRSPSSSPTRPNPLLSGLRSRTPTPPRTQANLDNSPFPSSPDADIASATSSKKSKRRSSRESRSAMPTASASFEPAAFLQSMFDASVPTGSSVVPAAVASMFGAAAPTPQEPTRRSTRSSAAGKSKKATSGPPQRRTRERANEKLPEGGHTSASATPAMAGGPPSSTPTRRSREGGGQGRRTTSRGSLKTSDQIPPTKSPTGTTPATNSQANCVPARGGASAATDSPPARSSVNSSASNESTRTLTPDHLKNERDVTIEKKVAAWDLPSSAESSPTHITFSSGKKTDHVLLSAKPKQRPKQSAKKQAASGPSSAVQKIRPAAPPPPTRSFIDMFGSSRTPSFDNLPVELEDGLLRTAEFGGDTLLTPRPTLPPTLGVDTPKAGTRPEQQGSPTKDPNRRARIDRALSMADSEASRSCPPSPEKKKVGLASLASRPPVVRFARVQDIAVADKSLLGSRVPAFAQLGLKMYEQRVLSSNWQLDNLDLKALAIWYLPYLLLAISYGLIILLAGQGTESLLISVPLFLCLPLLHMARLALSNHSLQRTVDNAALTEFHDQLNSPVGWSSNAVFMATLGHALQAFQKSFPRLLASPPMHLPMRSAIAVSAALSFLGFVRSMRASGIDAWESMEAVLTVFALSLVIFVGCSPTGVGDRAKDADNRLSVLEAAFNTMLDTLRPLMGDFGGGAAACSEAVSPGGALVAFSRFSVRLITTDRNTLRCDLHVVCKDSPQLFVSCPLANFTIHSNSIDGIAPTDLGVSAAHPTVLASQSTSTGSPGRGQGLNAVAASMGINLGERRQRRREDDEISISLASASTASTLRSRRIDNGGFQPSAALMKLAMEMVTKLTARSNEPLEAFRPTGRGVVFPPKAAVGEPSLLIALSSDSVKAVAEASSDPCHWEPKRPATSTEDQGHRFSRLRASLQRLISSKKKGESTEAVKTFGVLRNAAQMDDLCRALPQGASGLSDPRTFLSQPVSTPLGRLSSDSESDEHSMSDDDELRKRQPSAADDYLNQADIASQHLAVVFDTIEERDRCHSLFEVAGLLPEPPPPDWS